MIQNFDIAIFRWFNSWAGVSSFFDGAIVFRATYLWYIVMAAVAAFVLTTFLERFRERRKRHIELFIFTFISAFVARFIVTGLIHALYSRPRPFEVLEGVRHLVNHEIGGSFPSGHASLAFAVAMSVYFYYPKTSILFFIAALSIGFGRVSAGVHWPSDILAGAIVGIGTAWCIRSLFKKFLKKN